MYSVKHLSDTRKKYVSAKMDKKTAIRLCHLTDRCIYLILLNNELVLSTFRPYPDRLQASEAEAP